MNKKNTIIFVIAVSMIQFILLGFFNYKFATYEVYTLEGKSYAWFLIIQLGLNEVVVLSIGFLMYFKEELLKSKSLLVSSSILLVSVVLLLGSGIYYGISFDSYLTSSLPTMFNDYLNTYYVIYGVTFLWFMISIFISKLFENLPKLLLAIMFTLIVTIYLYSTLYYGWSEYPLLEQEMRRPLRYLLSAIIMYPLYISMYIVSGLYIYRQYKEDKNINKN